MKKFYNIFLIILIIIAIIVALLICIKYAKNQVNEKNLENVVTKFEEEIKQESQEDVEQKEKVNLQYEGYKIEGIIEIPKINIKYPILEKTDDDTMKKAITKFWGPDINEVGNLTLAGHNNKDGTMFGKTKYLKIGDIIKLTDLYNNTVEYEIFKIYLVDPDDISCIESVESGKKEVTLITCTNGHKNRLIIKATAK